MSNFYVSENPNLKSKEEWYYDKENSALNVHSIYAYIFEVWGIGNKSLLMAAEIAMNRVDKIINK